MTKDKPPWANIALTYANDKNTDGAGAQLQRIYGIYAISRFLQLPYFHSPLKRIGYQGLSALENNSASADLEARYNRTFQIPSDIELSEDWVVHEMHDADADRIKQLHVAAKSIGKCALIRILYPYPVTDRDPELYRRVKAVSPFQPGTGDVFRLAIHVRRGELMVVDSHRMLPNSYFVSCARQFVEALNKLDIPFVCELYTEAPSKPFVVTPEHHGIDRRVSGNVTLYPDVNHLEEFAPIPNLQEFVNGDPIETLRRMATADALVLSHSSYSYVAAILNANGIVVYHPFWHSPLKEWLISDEIGHVSDADLVAQLKRCKHSRKRVNRPIQSRMPSSVTDLVGADSPAAATSPAIHAPLQNLDAHLESLLRPFLDQSAPARSIVAVRCDELLGITRENPRTAHATLLRLAAQEDSGPAIVDREPIRHEDKLDNLAQQVRVLCGPVSGDDLLLLPAQALKEMMTPLADEFAFRAVAAILPETPDELSGTNGWKLRRSLFDRGLVCVGSAQVGGCKALCFLSSDAVRSFSRLDVESRGHISMSTLLEGAGFANQLFRYAYVKIYALRHGLTAAFPPWDGGQFFGLEDKSCADLDLPRLSYPGFSDNDREMRDRSDPPINIDLLACFREIPECWRKHRPLLRHLFQLPSEQVNAINSWRDVVTEGGRRTLVAIHVRGGDDRKCTDSQHRSVPEDWYLDWLRAIWPVLRAPLLFIATDDPETILPVFQEFETVSAAFGPIADGLPEYLKDFEIMRRADYLAVSNSSFSRMAAILAPSTQRCFLASFQTETFAPYQPWIDSAFWARFADPQPRPLVRKEPLEQPTATVNNEHALEAPAQAAILFDVSDLLRYLLHHNTLTGIQRVQCEILINLLDAAHTQPIHLIVLNDHGQLGAIPTSALLDIIENLRADAGSRAATRSGIRAVLRRVVPCKVRPRDMFLTLGVFWAVRSMGRVLQRLKNDGVTIGVFIHDIIPITAPEYFLTRNTRMFVKAVSEALMFADFVATTTEYNKASLTTHMASRKLDPLPVHVVPLGHGFSPSTARESKISGVVAAVADTGYVLCVGTIEVRKNPVYLFNIWKRMVKSGRSDIPYLVFAGRKGWFVQDFLEQLKDCNYLGGRILLVHDVTDVELDLLYRKCILTVFPSFVEGWGLPVGESLAHGKICICSATGGIPEVGGGLVDYIDPYNECDGLEKLLRYLDDPELRRARELEIAGHFEPRSWRAVAEELLRSTQALAHQARRFKGVAAVPLPAGRFLPITSDVTSGSTSGTDAALSPELMCISGWQPPESSGARAAQPATMIRFRADAPAGTRINLVLRLAAFGRDFPIRIRSGSGAETEASIPRGSEKMATLSCEVEREGLVTAHLSLAGAAQDGYAFSDESYWMLKALLYFDPKRVVGGALNKLRGNQAAPFPAAAPAPLPLEPPHRPESASHQDPILIRSAMMDDSRRATSFGAFLQTTDGYWPSEFTTDRDAPIFADHADRCAFYSGCGNSEKAPQVGRINDRIELVRRSNQFVSMSRSSEGSVFDHSGVWRGYGYFQVSDPSWMPRLSKEADSLSIAEESLAAAPFYEHSYLIFYNGNLQNYYHWLTEALLPLDILSGALGLDKNVKIALPKSMDIEAVFDHRETLRALGLDQYEIVEVPANLIRVREAIWVENGLVERMPAPYLKDFQRRIGARYAGLRTPRNRRLLVARKGPVRRIHNIEQVQALLSKYDFETVYLEGMSIVDQILLFQSAEFVIGSHGAGLANLLFCEPGTKVIEFMPSVEMRPFFWMVSDKLDLVYGLQFCATVPDRDFQAAINVDIGKLQALIHMVEAHR